MKHVLYYNCSKGNGTLSFKTLEWGLKTLNPLLVGVVDRAIISIPQV